MDYNILLRNKRYPTLLELYKETIITIKVNEFKEKIMNPDKNKQISLIIFSISELNVI